MDVTGAPRLSIQFFFRPRATVSVTVHHLVCTDAWIIMIFLNCGELLPMNYLVYHNWTTLYFIQEVTMWSWINCPYKLLKLKVQSLWKRHSLMGNVYMHSMITEQFKDENYHCTKGQLYTCLTNNTFKKNVWQNR